VRAEGLRRHRAGHRRLVHRLGFTITEASNVCRVMGCDGITRRERLGRRHGRRGRCADAPLLLLIARSHAFASRMIFFAVTSLTSACRGTRSASRCAGCERSCGRSLRARRRHPLRRCDVSGLCVSRANRQARPRCVRVGEIPDGAQEVSIGCKLRLALTVSAGKRRKLGCPPAAGPFEHNAPNERATG
jgi:hypothetical protein